jgi:uncharacterized membrane protein YraQ (UPF0718 family)
VEEESDRSTQKIAHLVSTETSRSIVIVIFWAAAIAALFSRAMFQKTFPDTLDYAEILAVCVAAGALLEDIQKALIGCLAALAIGLTTVFIVAIVAVSVGGVPSSGIDVLQAIWIYIIFQSIFPFPLIEFVAASMIGSLIGERFLQ